MMKVRNYVFLIFFSVSKEIATLSDTEVGNVQKSRTVREQPRQLSVHPRPENKTWYGLPLVCDPYDRRPSYITTTPIPVTDVPTKLRVVSIESTGVLFDRLEISVKYEAPVNHSTEWLFVTKFNSTWRTPGTRCQHSSSGLAYFSSVFHDISQLSAAQRIHFLLYDDTETIKIALNISELYDRRDQILIQPPAGTIYIKDEFYEPTGSDLKITFVVHKDGRDFSGMDSIEISFTGMNITSSPPMLFKVFNNINQNAIWVSGTRINTTTNHITITIQQQFVENGGILSVRIPHKETVSGLVQDFHRGPLIKIKARNDQNLFTGGVFGTFHFPKQTFVYPPLQSIPCIGIGSTAPEVSIWKMWKGKPTLVIKTTIIRNKYMEFADYILTTHRSKNRNEHYFCRVRDEHKTIEAHTEVIYVDPVRIDDAKTGVMRNTSKGVRIACKATGKPRPKLQLRLYEEYGPNLINSKLHKVKVTFPYRSVARVALWLSPTDVKTIHTVYCVAVQDVEYARYDVRKIEIFPGAVMENNWELYKVLEEQAGNLT